jgi:hypothetical protein
MTCFEHPYTVSSTDAPLAVASNRGDACPLCIGNQAAGRGEVLVYGSEINGVAVILDAPLGLGASLAELSRLRTTVGPDVRLLHSRPCCCRGRAARRAENARAYLERRRFVLRGRPGGFPHHPRLLDQLRYAVEGAV